MGGLGVLWTEDTGKCALEGLSSTCVKGSGRKWGCTLHRKAANHPWLLDVLPLLTHSSIPPSCKVPKRRQLCPSAPYPFLLFALEPTANRLLAPETALVATTGAPYRTTSTFLSDLSAPSALDTVSHSLCFVVVSLLLLLCLLFLMRHLKQNSEENDNINSCLPRFSNDRSVVVLTYFYTNSSPTLTLPLTYNYFKINRKLLSPC